MFNVEPVSTANKSFLASPTRFIAGMLLPASVAFLAVVMEPLLTTFSKGRESVLPCIMVLLLFALVHPRFRHFLIVTLCYGVSFLAFRDVFYRTVAVVLPPSIARQLPFNLDIVDLIRAAGLLLVAILAAAAAIGESIQPGTVWARRCYFGAAALYFSGLGLLNYLWHSSWQSLMLCLTGVTAMAGCIFADRIVASEAAVDAADLVSDDAVQQLTYDAHRRTLLDKEWRDNDDTLDAAAPGMLR